MDGLFQTNFSHDEFVEGTPEELIPSYNRVWEPIDYIFKSPNVVEVSTNLFILANQTQGVCPGHGNYCNETIPCKKGRISGYNGAQTGIETGNCIPDDSPNGKLYNLSTCEKRGIVSRLLLL